jgi:polyphosphate kinase 2 (PPK2 family)
MTARTSTEAAPWTVVSSQDKHWARIRVLETVCDALNERL